jgi:hypothetical protein
MTEDHIGIRLDGVIYVKLDHVKPMRDRIEKLEAAMRSIAANACCDSCREAALVARKALEGKDD